MATAVLGTLLRDQEDYNRHIDYIHWNPVRHHWIKNVSDWQHSSFQRYVEKGIYPANWGNIIPPDIEDAPPVGWHILRPSILFKTAI